MTEGSLSCPIPIASPAVKICGQNVVAVVDVVVQSLGHILLFGIPWTAACQAPLFSTICQSLLKFMSVELVMLSNHLLLCHPLLLLPSIFPNMRYFTMRQVSLHQVAKVLELQLLGALWIPLFWRKSACWAGKIKQTHGEKQRRERGSISQTLIQFLHTFSVLDST